MDGKIYIYEWKAAVGFYAFIDVKTGNANAFGKMVKNKKKEGEIKRKNGRPGRPNRTTVVATLMCSSRPLCRAGL